MVGARLELPFSNAAYTLGMTEGENVNFYTRDPARLATGLVDKLDDDGVPKAWPTVLGTGWRVEAITGQGIVRFNLPDAAPALDLSDLSIVIVIDAVDVDHYGNPNDAIDLDSKPGVKSLVHEIRLDEDAAGTLNPNPGVFGMSGASGNYLAWQAAAANHVGINEEGAQNEEDGSLYFNAGDAVPLHFLQGVQNVKATGLSGLPAGSCAGTASCVRP